jgi:hypothetical protein
MWSVGGTLAYLAGQSCVAKRLSTSQAPEQVPTWCLSKNIQSRRQKKKESRNRRLRVKKNRRPTGPPAKKNGAVNPPKKAGAVHRLKVRSALR